MILTGQKMGFLLQSVRIVFLLALVFTTSGQAFAAPTASEVVKEFYTALQDTMKEGPALGFEGRYKKLDPAVRKAFNLPLMARYAVGPTWAKQTPDKQAKLVEAFSKFSIATYASRFTKSDGEVFSVIEEKPMKSGSGIMVNTTLKPKDGAPVTLNYLVRNDEQGQPRIADVYLDASISELATRRAEFTSVIKRDGFDKLVSSLDEKIEMMSKPRRTTP
jgi:phospholipid transport system substrate-binding protein